VHQVRRTPHPARRCFASAIHPLPQGERVRECTLIESLPLHVLLFGQLGRLVLRSGACNANRIALGNAVWRRDDDAIVRRETGGELDGAAEVAGDRDRLEQDLVVAIDGRYPQAVLVEEADKLTAARNAPCRFRNGRGFALQRISSSASEKNSGPPK